MSPPKKRHGPQSRAALLCAACVTGLLLTGRSADAQTATAPGTAAPYTGAGTSAGVSGPAPTVSSGLPGADTTGPVLTLPGVVARVLGNNSGLEIARERLQRAQESINQVNAQARPQFRLNANNTYSSYAAFPAALAVPTIANPALPDNGTIPAVTDQANSFSTAFIGGSSLSFGGGSGTASPGVAGGTAGGSGTAGVAGTTTPGAGASTSSATAPSTPGVGGTTGTTGSTTGTTGGAGATGTAPGGGAGAGTATGANRNTTGAGTGNSGNAPASGGTTGGTAPASGTGTNGTSLGTGRNAAPGAATPNGAGATGMALLAYPAIVADYVADLRTLMQPPSSSMSAPIAPAPRAQARPGAEADARPDAQPRPSATSDPNGTTGVTAARGERDTYATGGNVTQYIDLFGLVGTARIAERDVRDFYALDITRLQNETAYAAKNLFFNVLYAEALVATQQEQVAFAQENVRITQSRLRNGVVSRFDVLTAQTALATAQQQLTAAQDQYQLAQSELAYLLGTDPDQPQTLQSPALPPLDQTIDLRQSTRIAERQRPELGQAARNTDNAQRQVRLAAEGLLPTLGLVGSGEYTSNGSTVTPRSFATVSAQVAVPLDDGGLTRSRVRSAQVQVQTQAITAEQLQLSVALEVRQATINVRNAQAQAASAQVSVASSQEAVRLARERYGAGIGTFLDVLNSLAQLATTRTNLANAQYFYQSSLAQVVRAMGGR